MRGDQKERFRRLGLNIAYQRKINGLTQERLSEKIGISRTHLGRIETGDCAPSVEVLFDLAEALGISADRFFRSND